MVNDKSSLNFSMAPYDDKNDKRQKNRTKVGVKPRSLIKIAIKMALLPLCDIANLANKMFFIELQ